MQSVLGTILDPAADKLLMTTLAVTLTMKGLLPSVFPLSHSIFLLPFQSVWGYVEFRGLCGASFIY